MAANPPPSPVPLTPMVQQARGAAPGALKDPLTSDTRLSPGSYAAARRAAGAVLRAIEEVLSCRARNAICVVRPPGHHAGVRGLTPGSVSCGFCVFNSAMVGAAHALRALRRDTPPSPSSHPQLAAVGEASEAAGWAATERAHFSPPPPLHPPLPPPQLPPPPMSGCVSRVALVDFDVHHGDGSEEIVRRLSASLPPSALFFASIHLYDPGDTAFTPFYPGSGAADAMPQNIINVPLPPMWRSGKLAPPKPGRGRGGLVSPRQCGCGRAEWREAFAQRVLPALRAFAPELLLLSSGFDGGCGDIGNSKLDAKECYHQGLDLTPADFAWATTQLLGVAAVCCPGKVVSILEGGYGGYVLNKEAKSGLGISRSNLAENVAAHLSALCGVDCHAD
uniref:histone deacetylase n=1 Tax=Emiliania huxleyi TaxID=2903 RepID=A0A7S3W4A9_EMIHU